MPRALPYPACAPAARPPLGLGPLPPAPSPAWPSSWDVRGGGGTLRLLSVPGAVGQARIVPGSQGQRLAGSSPASQLELQPQLPTDVDLILFRFAVPPVPQPCCPPVVLAAYL